MQLAKEAWTWIEVYNDGNVIFQFNENGSRHFKDIKQENLKMFILRHFTGKEFALIPSEDNWRLIHFYRVKQQLGRVVDRYPMVGYQETKDGINFKVLFKLHDNGIIEQVRE